MPKSILSKVFLCLSFFVALKGSANTQIWNPSSDGSIELFAGGLNLPLPSSWMTFPLGRATASVEMDVYHRPIIRGEVTYKTLWGEARASYWSFLRYNGDGSFSGSGRLNYRFRVMSGYAMSGYLDCNYPLTIKRAWRNVAGRLIVNGYWPVLPNFVMTAAGSSASCPLLYRTDVSFNQLIFASTSH